MDRVRVAHELVTRGATPCAVCFTGTAVSRSCWRDEVGVALQVEQDTAYRFGFHTTSALRCTGTRSRRIDWATSCLALCTASVARCSSSVSS